MANGSNDKTWKDVFDQDIKGAGSSLKDAAKTTGETLKDALGVGKEKVGGLNGVAKSFVSGAAGVFTKIGEYAQNHKKLTAVAAVLVVGSVVRNWWKDRQMKKEEAKVDQLEKTVAIGRANEAIAGGHAALDEIQHDPEKWQRMVAQQRGAVHQAGK